jgi:hypothetical protein
MPAVPPPSLTYDNPPSLERCAAWSVGIVLPMLDPGVEGQVRQNGRGVLRRRGPETEVAMPLYHFDLVNTKTITDQGGAELPDDIEAMDSADEMARRILDERPSLKDRHYAIVVTNEDGEEVCRLPLDVIH